MSGTPLETQTQILADLWINYKQDEEFIDFIEYNDLGLPLAYAIENKIISTTPAANAFIVETFDLLLAGLNIDEDTGFDSLTDLLDI